MVKVSLVNGINQTNHSTNQERPTPTNPQNRERDLNLSIFSMLEPGEFSRVEFN